MIGFGIMLCLAGIIVMICVACVAMQNHSYNTCSNDVTATIAYKRSIHSKNGYRYEFETTYNIDGRDYKKTVGGSLTEYDTLQVGDTIQLKYKPDNPKKAIRADRLVKNGLRPIVYIAAGLFFAGVILIIMGRK